MTKIYIDFQTTRNKHRVRFMQDNREIYAYYCTSLDEAKRVKQWARKIINALEPKHES